MFQKMMLSFNCTELKKILQLTNRSKSGKKNDLQQRVLGLLQRGVSLEVQMKIRAMYESKVSARERHNHISPPCSSHGGPETSNSSSPPLVPIDPGPSVSTAVHAGIVFERLPFYDVLETLLSPTRLAVLSQQRSNENFYMFRLSDAQMDCLKSNEGCSVFPRYEVQLRFAMIEEDCAKPQPDDFPFACQVKVNDRMVCLPNFIPTNKPSEQKRLSRPVDITPHLNLSRANASGLQRVIVSWTASSTGKNHAITVCYVQHVNANILLQRLKDSEDGKSSVAQTKELIKRKLTDSGDIDIATTSLRVSLLCPLGKIRLQLPCKTRFCAHIQCFDAYLFLAMNERKPTWLCPLCDLKAPYADLVIDGFLSDVLSSAVAKDVDEIELESADGTWKAVTNADVCTLSDDEEEKPSSNANAADGSCSSSVKENVVVPKNEAPTTAPKRAATSSQSLVAAPVPVSAVGAFIDLTETDSEPEESGSISGCSEPGGESTSSSSESSESDSSVYCEPVHAKKAENTPVSTSIQTRSSGPAPSPSSIIVLDSSPEQSDVQETHNADVSPVSSAEEQPVSGVEQVEREDKLTKLNHLVDRLVGQKSQEDGGKLAESTGSKSGDPGSDLVAPSTSDTVVSTAKPLSEEKLDEFYRNMRAETVRPIVSVQMPNQDQTESAQTSEMSRSARWNVLSQKIDRVLQSDASSPSLLVAKNPGSSKSIESSSARSRSRGRSSRSRSRSRRSSRSRDHGDRRFDKYHSSRGSRDVRDDRSRTGSHYRSVGVSSSGHRSYEGAGQSRDQTRKSSSRSQESTVGSKNGRRSPSKSDSASYTEPIKKRRLARAMEDEIAAAQANPTVSAKQGTQRPREKSDSSGRSGKPVALSKARSDSSARYYESRSEQAQRSARSNEYAGSGSSRRMEQRGNRSPQRGSIPEHGNYLPEVANIPLPGGSQAAQVPSVPGDQMPSASTGANNAAIDPISNLIMHMAYNNELMRLQQLQQHDYASLQVLQSAAMAAQNEMGAGISPEDLLGYLSEIQRVLGTG